MKRILNNDTETILGLMSATSLIMPNICHEFRTSEVEIMSDSRNRNIVLGRQVLMSILRDQFRFTFEAIGIHLNREHGTVMHGINSIAAYAQTDKKFRVRLKRIFSHVAKARSRTEPDECYTVEIWNIKSRQ